MTAASLRIRFMRISSELFPFASHDKYGYDLEYAATELKVSVLSPARRNQEGLNLSRPLATLRTYMATE